MWVCLSGSTALTISGDTEFFALFDRATVRESDTGRILSRGKEYRALGREPPELGTDGRKRFEFGRVVLPAFGREGGMTEEGVL
jgi:hypothetical protein